MGADGGSIPRRSELVRTRRARSPESAKATELQFRAAWTTCALSREPLVPPVVACALGRMYNRAAVIVHLLSRRTAQLGCSGGGITQTSNGIPHITSLNDVVELKLTANPEFLEARTSVPVMATAGVTTQATQARFVCPLSGRELNGRHRFVYHTACGDVVAEQALRELGKGTTKCVVCGGGQTVVVDKCATTVQHRYVSLCPSLPSEIEALRALLPEWPYRAKKAKRKRAISDGDKEGNCTRKKPSAGSNGNEISTATKLQPSSIA